MSREVRLNRVRNLLKSLDYPLTKEDARAAVDDVTLVYADGEEPLADVISRSNDDTFDDVADLEADVYANLPTEAVGEPGQSEGEG